MPNQPTPSQTILQSPTNTSTTRLAKTTKRPRRAPILLEIGGLVLFFSALLLFDDVMGGNEVDVLPLARQYAQPDWMPNDWYLNQPEGYRLLFQTIVGHMIASWGFLAASLVGRFVCYLFLSTGIVFIARKLSLRFPFLIFAITLNQSLYWIRGAMANAESYVPGFADDVLGRRGADLLFYGVIVLALGLLALSVKNNRIDRSLGWLLLAAGCLLASDNRPYSIVSNEWYAGGLEAKAVAYGLVFCAIALMLNARYLWTALLLGIATSFHVLAGGYAMLVTSLYLLLRKRAYFNSWSRVFFPTLLYALGSICAMPAVFAQLLTDGDAGPVSSSFIYVFIRLPHHLNPDAWPDKWWLSLVFYLSVLAISRHVIKQALALSAQASPNPLGLDVAPGGGGAIAATQELFEFTLVAMLPFTAGLLIAPFDKTGALLQYYPFRFSDMILPFSTCLLFALALQRTAERRKFVQRPLMIAMAAVVVMCLAFETQDLSNKISAIRQFPDLPTDREELYQWVTRNTEPTDTVVTPPAGLENFAWITERPTTAKLKLLPQTSAGIIDWYGRLGDLSGNAEGWSNAALSGDAAVFNRVSEMLTEGYAGLSEEQISNLLKTYEADYFVTAAEDKRALPIAFQNDSYVVYQAGS